VKFGLDLRHRSYLRRPPFRNEATNQYQSFAFGAAVMELLFSPNLVQFGRPLLTSRVWKSAPPLQKIC